MLSPPAPTALVAIALLYVIIDEAALHNPQQQILKLFLIIVDGYAPLLLFAQHNVPVLGECFLLFYEPRSSPIGEEISPKF